MHKRKKVFIEGPISPNFIADSISKHGENHKIGGHSIFLGQVRNDLINDKEVQAIEYSSYEEMAEEKFAQIREETFELFDLTCMHIFHSLGIVNKGEISLFIFTSSKHRKAAIEACSYLVERIKKEVPIWGKEKFENENFQWKNNQ